MIFQFVSNKIFVTNFYRYFNKTIFFRVIKIEFVKSGWWILLKIYSIHILDALLQSLNIQH